jgi:hypothetical protein
MQNLLTYKMLKFTIKTSVYLLRVLVGRPEGKRPLGRPRRRWENNIQRDLQDVGGGLWELDGAGSG